MNKKIITVLALVLVIAAALVACTACSGKEAAKEENAKMSLTFVNQTGETVTNITVKERSSAQKQEWAATNLEADGSTTLVISTVVKDGAPDLDFSFTTASGQAFGTMITTKGDKTIVMKADPEGGCVAEVTSK